MLRSSALLRRPWLGLMLRTRREAQRDHLTMIAAAVAFYAFLSVFPALALLVSLYGLLSDPNQVEQQLAAFASFMPRGVYDVLSGHLQQIAGGPTSALSWGFALSLVLATWSATKGTKSLIEAMNITYDEQEKRGIFELNAVALLFTLGAVLTTIVALFVVVGIPSLFALVGLGGIARVAVDILRWPVMIALLLFGLAVLYRFGPSRENPRWRLFSPGSLLAAGLWVCASIVFSIYVANFGSYDKTYGSLGAVVILLLWLYAGAYVVLLGAEVNAEAERHPRRGSQRSLPF